MRPTFGRARGLALIVLAAFSLTACASVLRPVLSPPAGRAASDVARDLDECEANSRPGVTDYTKATGKAVGVGLVTPVVAPVLAIWVMFAPTESSGTTPSAPREPAPSRSGDLRDALLGWGAVGAVVGIIVAPVVAVQTGSKSLKDTAQRAFEHCLVARGYAEPPPPPKAQHRVLVVFDREANTADAMAAFLAELERRQHMVGKTLYVEVRSTDTIGRESGWNVAVVASERDLRALRDAMPGTPIVMAGANVDPVAMGIALASGAPSANVTGTIAATGELNQGRLRLLRQAVPSLRRIAVLVNPDNPAHAAWSAALEEVARDLSVTRVEAKTETDLDAAFATAAREAADALLVLPDAEYSRLRAAIASRAQRGRLPTMAGDAGFADAGGLLTYHPALVDSWREAAVYVDRILTGTSPRSLPIRTVTEREFVVNEGTAKALGLSLPPQVMLKATRVIP